MDCEGLRVDTAIPGGRWQAIERAFNDLADTDAPVGGCNDVEFESFSGRLKFTANLDPMEGSSNFSLVCRLIASVTPEEQVGARARALLGHYLDFRGMVRAAVSDCPDQELLTDAERAILRTVRDVTTSYLRECSFRQRRINSFADLHAYLKVSLATEESEVTRLLFLDGQRNLIADELHGSGKLNQTSIFPKKVVARIVAHNAAALIIVHSHPRGEPDPTKDDILLTRRLAFVLEELGVTLYDHVVVGQRVVISLRRLGIFGEEN